MIHGESGKFTLEASLVLPLVLVMTFACLFAASDAARHAGLNADAAKAGTRAAFNWDNSGKAAATGAFYPGQYDDLYWRITQDFPGSALTARKIGKALGHLPESAEAEGEYDNRFLIRTVSVAAGAGRAAPGLPFIPDSGGQLRAAAASVVTEPAETVRLIDTARTYWPVIRTAFSERETDGMVEEFRRRPGISETGPLSFASHDEARAYLQGLVRGRLSRVDTESVGEWRMIDALDSFGIAHQAYFAFKSEHSDIVRQMLKDEELLRRGMVKGVVWHFFRRERDGSIGLSDGLRRMLEERGIVVIVHE